LIPRLVLASKNPDKLAEMEAVLSGFGLYGELARDLDWPDVDELGETLEDNALLKAVAVVEATGLPALADDTGLEVGALGGAPGAHARRFAGPDASYDDNVQLLLSSMEGVADRSARFRTVVVLAFPDGAFVAAHGVLDGVITTSRRGHRGFGYDPVFEVDGRTLAEMSDGEKNSLSHRARALRALAASLELDR
jgi:XTP/dITP diphosphohydrolase